MRNLDARGIIAAVEIAIYVPLLITSIILVKRHGFRRSGGWLFFVIFSIGKLLSPHTPSILTTLNAIFSSNCWRLYTHRS